MVDQVEYPMLRKKSKAATLPVAKDEKMWSLSKRLRRRWSRYCTTQSGKRKTRCRSCQKSDVEKSLPMAACTSHRGKMAEEGASPRERIA